MATGRDMVRGMERHQRMKHQAKREFEAWADSYDKSLLHHFLFRPTYWNLLGEIVRWHRERNEPFDYLDIGCGSGELINLVRRSNLPARSVGMDYAPSMCRVAREKTIRQNNAASARFTAADSEHLPFADDSFDLITCSNSFHHYPHQPAVVAEMRRLLRPGGRLMLADGFRDNVIGWVVFDVIIGRVEQHVFHAPWHTIRQYFQDAGFKNIHHQKFNVLFPVCLTVGDAIE